MLDKIQAENLKKQLLSQLENSNIQNKEDIKASIVEMNDEELEEFLMKNNLIKSPNSDLSKGKCIFCSIVDKEIPTYLLDENKEAIAVLEINPISKGHVIVIPKIHSKKTPKEAIELAKEISEKIKKIFKPKKTEIASSSLFGHEIINILPIYDNETLKSPRKKESEEDLLSLQKLLSVKKKQKTIKKSKMQKTEKINLEPKQKLWLPRRIP